MPAAHPQHLAAGPAPLQQQSPPPPLPPQDQQQGPLLPQLPGAAPVPALAPQQEQQQQAPAALQLPSPSPSTLIVQFPGSRGSDHARQPRRAPSSSQLSTFPVGVSPCPSPLPASAQDPLPLANSRPSPSTAPSVPRHPSGDASPGPDQPAAPAPRQHSPQLSLPPISPSTPAPVASSPPPASGSMAAVPAMLEAFLQDSAALAAEMASGCRVRESSSGDAGALSPVPSEADLDPVLSFAPGLVEVRAAAPGPAPAVPADTTTSTTVGAAPLQQSSSPLPRRSRQRALSSHNQPSLTADGEGPLPRLIGVLQRELYTQQQQQQQQYAHYASSALPSGPPYALQSPGMSSRAAYTGAAGAPASSASVNPLLGRTALAPGAPHTTGGGIGGGASTPIAPARPVRALSQGAGLAYVHSMAEHVGSGVLRAVSEVEESDGSLPALPEIVSSAGTPTWGVRQGGGTAQGDGGGHAGGDYAQLGSLSGPVVHHAAGPAQLRSAGGSREHPGAARDAGPGTSAAAVRQRLGRMSSVGCDEEGNERSRDVLGELGNGRERGPMGLARRARERFRRYFSEDGSGAGEPPAVQPPAAPGPPPRGGRGLLLAGGSSGGGVGGATGPDGAELGAGVGAAVGAAGGVRVGPSGRRLRSPSPRTSGRGERQDAGASDDGGPDTDDELHHLPAATQLQQQLSGLGAAAAASPAPRLGATPGAVGGASLRRSEGGARAGPLQVMQSLARVFRRGGSVRPRVAPAGVTAPGGLSSPGAQQQPSPLPRPQQQEEEQWPRRSAAPRKTE